MYNLMPCRNSSFLFIFILLSLIIGCKKEESDKFSSKEKTEILDTIQSRMKIGVEDYVIVDKKPTNILFITSAFLLDQISVEIYKKKGWVENNDTNLEDLIGVEILKYNLKREDGRLLKIDSKDKIEVGNSPYFEENKAMYSNFYISVPLDNHYTKLNGNITTELKIDDEHKRQFTIPIKLNITDFFDK
jgi:hypothetical protein